MRDLDDGFEIPDSLGYIDTSGTLAWSTTTALIRGNGAGGARSIRLTNDTIGHALTPASEIYLRFGLYIENWVTSFKFLVWRTGSTELGSLRADLTTTKIKGYTGTSTNVLTHSTILQTDKWYLVHVRIKLDDASGVIEVILDNSTTETYNGDTKPGADTTLDRILHISGGTDAFHIDDLSVNNTDNSDGRGDTGYPSNAYLVAMLPNAAGDNTGLTSSSGGANYTNVDETTPSAADYNEKDSAGYDLYHTAPYTLLSGQTIVAYRPIARAWGVGAGVGANAQVGVKTTTEDWSASQTLAASMAIMRGKRYIADHAGGTLNQAFLDAIQVGFKVV